jgi:hypothetical protein
MERLALHATLAGGGGGGHRHGAAPPEYSSTHPSDEHRAEALRAWLPEAEAARAEHCAAALPPEFRLRAAAVAAAGRGAAARGL